MYNGTKNIILTMINFSGSIEFLTLLYIFIFTIILTTVLIISKPYHIKFSNDELNGPQKIHDAAIPRIGGVSIFLIIFFISIFLHESDYLLYFVVASIPVFLSGFVEDLTKKVYSAWLSPQKLLLL